MAWIEAHQDLRDHPKTKRAARLLGISIPQMIGHLFCLWWWCLDYAEDGNLADFEHADIADAAEWPGDPDQFIDALVRCGRSNKPGFLVSSDETLKVNDWGDYGGKYIVKRNQGRDRQRAYRERNALVMHSNAAQHDVTHGNTPVSNADVTRYEAVSNTTREEERIEDKRTEEKPESGAKPPSATADISIPSSLPGWLARIKDSGNKPAELVAMFQALYPTAIDVPSFSYMGKVARQLHAGRLAEMLWQFSAKPPSGDVLAYCLKAAKNGTDSEHPKKASLDEILGFDKDGNYIGHR